MSEFTWSRYQGYECSTRGDARFSTFNAKLEDGRSIEQHYQCDVKGYDPGGTNWRLGKGRRPLYATDTWGEYLRLWKRWAVMHPVLIEELRIRAAEHNCVLRDRFATTPINQAHALSLILNSEE